MRLDWCKGLGGLLLLVAAAAPVSAASAAAAEGLEPFEYREDFEDRMLGAWASYPLWQDTAYDPNFRVNELIPGDANISIVQRSTPYSAVDNYMGAQKLFDAYLLPGDTIELRYYLKTHLPVEYFKVRLAAGEDGALDVTIDNPKINEWQTARVSFEDFIRENRRIAGNERIELNALAVLAKVPTADPAMPMYLGLDDVVMHAHRPVEFRFQTPAGERLPEFRPYIPSRPYHRGDMLEISGEWPIETGGIRLTISPLTDRGNVVFEKELKRDGRGWRLEPVRIEFPENLYMATLEAVHPEGQVYRSQMTLHVAPKDIGGLHPRLWFDAERRDEIIAKLQTEEFKPVLDGILKNAADERAKLKVDDLIYVLDQFPDEDWLPTWDAWGSNIYHTEGAVYWNALAWSLGGDREAGTYAKDVLLEISEWPDWTHPWQTKRGRFSEHRSGTWAHYMALGYDLTYDLMSEAERATVRDAFWRNLVDGVHKTYVIDNNITCDSSNWIAHVAGGSLMMQAAMYGDGGAGEWREPQFTGAALKLWRFINVVTDPAGAWGEGLGYNNYSYRTMSKSLPSLENVFGIDMTGPLAPIYKEYIWAGPVLDKKYFHFGDSGGNLGPIENWAFLLDKYRDPLLGWYYNFLKGGEAKNNTSDSIRSYMAKISESDTLVDVLHETKDIPMEDPFDLNPVKLFRQVGTTVFKSGWQPDDFIFVMRTGKFYNHQHLDQGSFWLAGGGETFITERHGSSYYDDPIYQSHYTQPIGHSTILIDGNEQSQRVGDHPYMAAGFNDYAFVADFLDGEQASFVSGDIGRLYWGKVEGLVRNVLYLKPRAVLMLDVATPAKESVDVTLLYQTERLADIKADAEHSVIDREKADLHFFHLAPRQVEVEGVATPHYLNVLRETRPLVREGMLTVTGRTQGGPLVMANLLTTTDGSAPAVETREGSGFVSGSVDGKPFAFSTAPGSQWGVEGFGTDALALTWSDGAVFMAKGRDLTRDGRVLVRSSVEGTFDWSENSVGYWLPRMARVTVATGSRPGGIGFSDRSGRVVSTDAAAGTVTVELLGGEGRVEFR